MRHMNDPLLKCFPCGIHQIQMQNTLRKSTLATYERYLSVIIYTFPNLFAKMVAKLLLH